MEHHFDTDLDGLKQKLLAMAGHAETAVNEAIGALVERDYDRALRVKANDTALDRFEIEVDEIAIQLLARAPLATDLRFVTVAMKISQNLERIGDEAVKIAKRARDLSQEPPLKVEIDLPGMAKLALELLKAALDAFVHRDSAAARALIPRDKVVDTANKQIGQAVTQKMMESPDNIKRGLNLITISRSLERIADHATNVAEDVVYLCEAEDIRHSRKRGASPLNV
jgi:phosphate transport system protein